MIYGQAEANLIGLCMETPFFNSNKHEALTQKYTLLKKLWRYVLKMIFFRNYHKKVLDIKIGSGRSSKMKQRQGFCLGAGGTQNKRWDMKGRGTRHQRGVGLSPLVGKENENISHIIFYLL